MDIYFNFFLQANLALGLLVLAYSFFLRNIPLFQVNRILLISFLLMSLLFPFIPSYFEFEESEYNISESIPWIEVPSTSEVGITKLEPQQFPVNQIDWILILTILHGLGAVWFLIAFIFQLVKLFSLKRKAQLSTWNSSGFYYLPNSQDIFSFFGWIFLNERWQQMDEFQKELIYEHEAVHSLQKHSLDLILVEFGKVFFWMNPAMWVLKRELRLQHEFFVDEVIQSKFDSTAYANLLLKISKHTGVQCSISNSISRFSILKKRIVMMTKQKALSQVWRYVLLLPVLIILVIACSNINNELTPAQITDPNEFTIFSIFLNGEKVNIKEGVHLEKIVSMGKADFEIRLAENEKTNEVLFGIAKGNRGILSRSKKQLEEKSIQKFSIPELALGKDFLSKFEGDKPRITIEVLR